MRVSTGMEGLTEGILLIVDGRYLLVSTEAIHGSVWDERSRTYCLRGACFR